MVRRNPRLIAMAGGFALLCVLVAGVAGYWRYANQLPVYPAPHIVMPVPHAFDDYLAAGQMGEAAGRAAGGGDRSGGGSAGDLGGPPGYPRGRRAPPARGSGPRG